MDKVEYKIRADEIKSLIGEGRYAEAVKIADTIDWKRVKSIQMLCTISDLYKINRRFEESRDVLLMAYEKHPTGRSIVYSLCELAIKMGEFVQAVEYYKEFVRITPGDPGRYILQYKLYEAQEVSLEERIAVLEEFKKHEYRERWAYELAYLYHRVGLATECVEECDEMFLWFGEGKYVMKALELKALHEPLSKEQQDRYNKYKNKNAGEEPHAELEQSAEKGLTQNLNAEPSVNAAAEDVKQPTKEMPPITDEVIKAFNEGNYTGQIPASEPAQAQSYAAAEQPQEDEIVYPHIAEIKEPYVDISAYNTMNLQETLAAGLAEIIASEGTSGGASQETKVYEPVAEEPKPEGLFGQPTGELKQPTGNMQELFFDTQSVEIPTAPSLGIDIKYGGNGPILGEEKEVVSSALDNEDVPVSGDKKEQYTDTYKAEEELREDIIEESKPRYKGSEGYKPAYGTGIYEEKPLEDEVPGAVIHPNASYQMPSHFESILSQEADGQISMAVSPEPMVEKQITGQISIAEYMANWEQYKKDQQKKQLQSVKKRVADETGDMFADFDEQTKVGLQEKIEKAISEAIKKEQYEKASGRGDWSVSKEDAINAAVAEVVGSDSVASYEETEDDINEEQETAEETFAENAVEEVQEAISEPEIEEQIEEAQTLEEEGQEESVAEIPEEVLEEAETEAPAEEAVEASEEVETATEPETEPITEESSVGVQSEEAASEQPVEPVDFSNTSDLSNTIMKEAEEPKAKAAPKTKDKPKTAEEQDDKAQGKKHIGNREIEERVRTMTPEEKELFGPYIHHKKSRRQIINAIDNLSMDAYSGNAIVTGEEGAGTVNLAKGLIKAVQASDSNFSGKVAKITANTLNKKSTAGIFEKLANGALIIQRAADLDAETVGELLGILQEENKGLIVVMEDTRDDMDKFLDKNPSLKQSFNVRVDIEALDDDSLVAYARQYALEKEYAIDNLGILALHTRISERQTLDHEVTVAEVKDIVDDAIYYAEKRTIGHFVDVIVNKRYDENDMVILREKDFMH